MSSATSPPPPSRFVDADDPVASAQWLVVWLGAERFAVPLSSVREMIEVPLVLREPALPANADGVVAGRDGRIVLWNAVATLGQAIIEPAGLALVLDSDSGPTGFLADRVADVMTIEDGSIRALPTLDDPARVVLGVARDAEGLIAMLDVARLTRTLSVRGVAA